jgi:ribosomal-protein-serine acetyltransferase
MEPLIAYNLCIRPFRRNDAPSFVAAALESVQTVGVWMPWCYANYSIDDAQAWFQSCARNLESHTAYEMGVFSADGEAFFGGVSINQLNHEHNFGNLGYWVRQSRQRQGIASQAVKMIAEFGFDKLRLTRLEFVLAEGNHASRRVAEKVGAQFECIARNRLFIQGKPHPAAIYSLVPADQ